MNITILTKHEISDTVYLYDGNGAIRKGKVHDIEIKYCGLSGTYEVHYQVDIDGIYNHYFLERSLYSNIDELLDGNNVI